MENEKVFNFSIFAINKSELYKTLLYVNNFERKMDSYHVIHGITKILNAILFLFDRDLASLSRLWADYAF